MLSGKICSGFFIRRKPVKETIRILFFLNTFYVSDKYAQQYKFICLNI
ncbi:hypothetical protein QSI_0498 [Clostridioides difficile P28]|nr:hypothetical protein QSI_0498 [Clostridioides difficile P28]